MTGFAPPPAPLTETGAPRRVGLELEMTGLSLDRIAGVVAGTLGLGIAADGRYERRLSGDPAGDWIVELDFGLLKRMGRAAHDPETFRGGLGRSAEGAVALFAEVWAPVEVVSPPLPLDRLDEAETLVGELRAAGARGTSDALLNAFGLQLNPEAPSTAAPELTALLRAFLCLYDWLIVRAQADLSRRLTSFVDPYPRAYVLRVLDPDYAPDRDGLIGDYLRWNATRNRALDLLPLFAHLAPARVAAGVADDRIKPRPAFHYRLPDCDIHRPDWTLAAVWNDWVEVERLAADPDRLAGCAAACAAFLERPPRRWFGDWPAEVEARWLGR